MATGYLVTTDIAGAHPKLDYPLFEGDLLVPEESDTWFKECPGLAVGGFKLSEEQTQTLKPVEFQRQGLNYIIAD